MKRARAWLLKRREPATSQISFFDAASVGTDESRITRAGRLLMLAGLVLEAVEPVITVMVMMALACVPSTAQTGGTIFGQDQSMVPNAVRQTVIFAAGIAFLIGALIVIWGAFQYSRRQECMNCFIGGGLLMTIGGVIALVSYLASGRAVTVDRTLN
ncbi:MAG: hypothetical protein M3444_00420 [Acidobacteriota bacterium]|nr:hypothetical protein [Acidobacteriota bacterium]